MKINFDSEILDLENKPITETVEGKVVNSTLKKICVNALMANLPTPQNVPQETGMEKFKKFNLSKKIYSGGEVEITAEDITLIKKEVGLCYSAVIVGPVYNLLEGKK